MYRTKSTGARLALSSVTKVVSVKYIRTLFVCAACLFFYVVMNTPSRKASTSLNLYDPFIGYRRLTGRDWHDYSQMEADKRRVGPGEGGKALPKPDDSAAEAKQRVSVADGRRDHLQDALYRQNGYDAVASDTISMERSVKDIRHPDCARARHLERLPEVSVVLPFHDEHFSALLRSVHSILNRSPKELIKEIIMVDDNSTKLFLKGDLQLYLVDKGMSDKVKVVRTERREGLIRARQIGAMAATGPILIFLDAHSEVNYNWLPPLIEPIAMDYRTVVCPFVDVIDCDTYEYRSQDEGARGSFDWSFNYKRLPLTSEDLRHPTRPFRSPVMAGGYFAISAKWFWELGGYDEGLDIWGGEQYELSFKVWQCHGRLVDAPCSRVGHIYRCKYVPFPSPNVGDFISRNYKRVAEVWMDDFKQYLYERRPEMKSADPGDLTKQRKIRTTLECKSFDWFLQEIAFDQEQFYPIKEPEDSAKGELRNAETGQCVQVNPGNVLSMATCKSDNPSMAKEQDFRMTFWNDLRVDRDEPGSGKCLDVASNRPPAPVNIVGCHGSRGNQHFKFLLETGQLFHPVSKLCMDLNRTSDVLIMTRCEPGKRSQKWQWTHVNSTMVEQKNKISS